MRRVDRVLSSIDEFLSRIAARFSYWLHFLSNMTTKSMSDSDAAFNPEDLLEHTGWMRTLARSLVVDEFSAEDIIQEVSPTLQRERTMGSEELLIEGRIRTECIE